MANPLDELTGPVSESGNDVNVIHKQLPVTIGMESLIFELFIFVVGFVPALVMTLCKVNVESVVLVIIWIAGIIPGAIYCIMKINAKNFFQQLQQRIQAQASEIDNSGTAGRHSGKCGGTGSESNGIGPGGDDRDRRITQRCKSGCGGGTQRNGRKDRCCIHQSCPPSGSLS